MKNLLLSLLIVFISNVALSQVRYNFASYVEKTEKAANYNFKLLEDIDYSNGLVEKKSISFMPSVNHINNLNGFSNNQDQWVGRSQKNTYYLNSIPIESSYQFNTQGDFIGSSFEIRFDTK